MNLEEHALKYFTKNPAFQWKKMDKQLWIIYTLAHTRKDSLALPLKCVLSANNCRKQ